jgi:hypothetical protein
MRLAWTAMKLRTSFIAIAAGSLLGACLAPDDISVTTDELRAPDDDPEPREDLPPAPTTGPIAAPLTLPGGGVNGDMCSNVGCSQNKAKLGIGYFHELNTAGETIPISYVGFKNGGMRLKVVGDEIRVIARHGIEFQIADEQLEGATLLVNQVQSEYELRFTGNFQHKLLNGSTTEFVTYYEIMVKRSGTDGPTWPLCSQERINNGLDNTTEGVNAGYATLFTGDRFSLEGLGSVSRAPLDGPWFNVACAGSPMALMLHRRLLTVTEPPGIPTSPIARYRIFRNLMPSQTP